MRGDDTHRQQKGGWIALAAIVALAACLRFWQLDAIPPGYHYDEAFEGLEAWKLLTQPGYHPIFFHGNFGVEPLFIYLTALAFRLFGAGPTTQRAVAALLGTLTVPALYGLARELRQADRRLSRAFPLLSAAALAVLYWHLHFSRLGIEPVWVPLLLVLAFWALWRGLRTGHLWPFAAAGLCLGLGSYAYPAGRLLPLLAIAFVAWLLLVERARLRSRWRGLALTLLVGLLVLAPLAVHFWRYPQLLTLRTSQVAVTGEGRGSLLENVWHTLGLWSVAGDADPRNNLPGRPALDGFIAVPFYLGLAVACWRIFAPPVRDEWPNGNPQSAIRNPQWAPRAVWGFVLLAAVVMLVPTLLSEYAPHFRRALGATPAAALLIGLGFSALLSWGQGRRVPKDGTASLRGLVASLPHCLGALVPWCLVASLLLGSAFITTRDYLGRWAASPDLYYAFDVGLWEIAQYVNGLPAEELVYVTPRPATHTTLAFAWREGQRTRHFDGRHAFVVPANAPLSGRPATYVVIGHEDFRGALLLRELYPQAQRVREFRDGDGRLYAEAFRIVNIGETARVVQRQRPAVWDGIRLIGYDLNAAAYRPGDIVYLQLWWACDAPVARDWKVFTHLLGPPRADGSPLWAGQDAEPGQGSVPTSTWQPGEVILDEYQLRLPQETPPGEYWLEIGLYEGAGGQRAPVRVSPPDDPHAPPDRWLEADHVILGAVSVVGG
ncbi:MAG: glycosyltransferase family 39 protein [Anaerolineae bacterium]|nr:glycosyltransferase family 39 protein [Anaerolineae bacterium]